MTPRLFLIPLILSLAWGAHCGAALGEPQPYSWTNVKIGGGGFVTGLLYHPTERGLLYARTDVGGAYRWNQDSQTWTPLTDFLGAIDVNLTGIESLAVDPRDPDRLYLAAGTYTFPRVPNGAILISRNRGASFERVDLPFKLGANEAGRGGGERLAVDPNDGAILFLGTRQNGLWRSGDQGKTWSAVKSFPDLATSPGASVPGWGGRAQPIGIVFVVFDPNAASAGTPTPELFAAVSHPDGGLYRSRDGGASWDRVADQPTGLRLQRAALSPDRWLYLTFGDAAAPNEMKQGAVWRFQVDKGVWEDITPERPTAERPFGYCGLALDPSRPSGVIVATFARWKPGDEIFRTSDGGATWKPTLAKAEWDFSPAPWTRQSRPHWLASLAIDPHNSSHAWFTTGYGVWETRNLAAADVHQPTAWRFSDEGLEETVPLGLISPPVGPHLLSAVGDLDGYRHDDLTRASPQFTPPPRYSNSEDIVYADQKPEIIARTGAEHRPSSEVHAAYSLDSGQTWQRFKQAPTETAQAGAIAVSADGAIFVWTPRGAAPSRTTDFGETWMACGLPTGVRVAADRINPQRFYALDARNGHFWISDNGAREFTEIHLTLPKADPQSLGFGGAPRGGGTLYAAPDREGEVWIAYRDDGLLRWDETQRQFTAVPGVQHAFSLGFGHPAPGKKHTALFLAGVIENVAGLFRSDDEGSTWLRLTDDQHQFGWINYVTGDPREYGRVYFGTGGRGIITGIPKKN